MTEDKKPVSNIPDDFVPEMIEGKLSYSKALRKKKENVPPGTPPKKTEAGPKDSPNTLSAIRASLDATSIASNTKLVEKMTDTANPKPAEKMILGAPIIPRPPLNPISLNQEEIKVDKKMLEMVVKNTTEMLAKPDQMDPKALSLLAMLVPNGQTLFPGARENCFSMFFKPREASRERESEQDSRSSRAKRRLFVPRPSGSSSRKKKCVTPFASKIKAGLKDRSIPSDTFLNTFSSLKKQALDSLAHALGTSLENFTEPRMFCACSYICHYVDDYFGFCMAIKGHSFPMYLLSKFPVVKEAVLVQVAAMFKGDFDELCSYLNQNPSASIPEKNSKTIMMDAYFDVSSEEVSKVDPIDTKELVMKYFSVACNYFLPTERYATREYLSAIRTGAKLAINNDDVIPVFSLPKKPEFELESWLNVCYDPKIVVHLPFRKQGKPYVNKAFFFSVYNTIYPRKITIAIGNDGKKKKENFFDIIDDDAAVVLDDPLEIVKDITRNAEYEI